MFSWTDLLPVAGFALGASQGNRGGDTTNTATKTLDPRLANYVFGQNGNGGLLADAASIYQQQMQTGGLNDMQRQGLDMQSQYLQSPQYSTVMNSLMNQGVGLLNRPVAGNPFTRSQGGQGGAPAGGGYQYRPSQVQAPIYRPAQQAPQVAAPGASNSTQPGRTGQGGGNINVGGGGQGTGAGGGYSESGIAASLAAMAASENPAIRALSPTFAALLGVGGRIGADVQMQGISGAFGAMNNIANTAQPGVGSLLNADGTVSTVSTPGLIAAADRAMFGGNDSGQGGGGYGNMGNGGYGGATGGYGGSYGSGSVGGFGGSDD